ncbi:MAG: WecB/TagA/CpsF family glycosyltransferase [Chthoniobacterales bacterium]
MSATIEIAPSDTAPTLAVLGIDFFAGTASEAVKRLGSEGGCVVIPASPALTKLNFDESYRDALQQADVVLPDSELLVLLSRMAIGNRLHKISGIDYLNSLLGTPSFNPDDNVLWLVSSEKAKRNAIQWLRTKDWRVADNHFEVIAAESAPQNQHALLLEIENRQPRHIVIALRGSGQEQLGIYLRDYLLYRPSIHCVGAALGFLSGDEHRIPKWNQRHHLGWLARLLAQPRMILPRLMIGLALTWMVCRYRTELPALRQRWSDL